jgi:hypothetical protein
MGTLNHFAKDLNIPLDQEQAIAVLAAGVHLEPPARSTAGSSSTTPALAFIR